MKQVVLDESSFKALSSDSRVSILKNLKSRRRTLTELSKQLSLGTSTVKEHCDVLRRAELIEQIDEGRKWKYYELTDKGRSVIAPSLYSDLQVLITLCVTVVIAAGILFFLLGTMGSVSTGVSNVSEDRLYSGTSTMETVASAGIDTTIQKETDYIVPSEDANIYSNPMIIPILAAALIIGILLGWKFKKK